MTNLYNSPSNFDIRLHETCRVMSDWVGMIESRNLTHQKTELKDEIYGNRVVIFAPLYISNFCVNNCKYCGYRRDNKFDRKKLTQEKIKQQAINLEKLGHKRLALEVGESPKETPIEYVVESIKTIYIN